MEADPTGGLMQMAMLYADDRKIEASRYKLSLEDKRPIIEGSIAETRG
jgi:hypothetical protein